MGGLGRVLFSTAHKTYSSAYNSSLHHQCQQWIGQHQNHKFVNTLIAASSTILPSDNRQAVRWYCGSAKDTALSSKPNTDAIDSDNDSANKRFQQIPVLPFIQDRIAEIGVGIRPRRTARRSKEPVLLSEAEERIYYTEQKKKIGQAFANRGASPENAILSCVPPPPFAPSHTNVKTHYFKTKNKTHNTSALKKVLIRTTTVRRPVKVIKKVASVNDELPKITKNLPEIALAGRSNVGKSTLLNALLYGNQFDVQSPSEVTKRRGKAPGAVKMPAGVKAITSDRPGETKEITFYQLSSQIIVEQVEDASTAKKEEESSSGKQKHSVGLILADLPGYGFAYASEERAKEWGELMRSYIGSRGLKRILLLIDARHGFKDADYEFLSSLEQNTNNLPMIQIVLTKCDLVTQQDLARRTG